MKKLIPLFTLFVTLPSYATIDITKIPNVIDKTYTSITGEMTSFIEGSKTPVLVLGSDHARETAFLLSQKDSGTPQGYVLTCHPSLKKVSSGTRVVVNINGGESRTTFDGKPNVSMWHGSITNDGCALAPVSLSEALYRVIDDRVVNVETWISVENNMNKAVSNAYFIGDSNIDMKYDLPFKMFMNNVAQVLNYTAS
ncbi:hypothetical protein XM72_u0013 [Vibrio vulnificus]|uniref:hypothetical protein n=1 Tax=Vibrio vulnificus TaxID=672 RepID=UPI0009B64944|nr:hypothetical protein [Vibrio vulnificus]OQK33432.1 hypothetical protein XM72_u0013 [Vibrio vulnificus]